MRPAGDFFFIQLSNTRVEQDFVFDIYGASAIISLTRQSVREGKAPRPGE